MKVHLAVLITSAWECNYPLIVGKCVQVANNLVEGTEYVEKLIAWKITHDCYNPNEPLLGLGRYRGFRERNTEIVESKIGQKSVCL